MDSRVFRQTVGQFVTGVTVIATENGGAVHAMTANSFTSLSLDPPLVLFCAGKRTKMGGLVRDAARFSVNILARTQQDVSSYFAGAWKQPEPPPFAFDSWEGVPRLGGCAATLACEVHAIQEGGDHWIVIGRVIGVARSDPALVPLVFVGGRYVGLDEAVASA
jgi:flavin reductase (DIM6/NTAB) family NADH-FMN oxidoreductase RutF